MNKVLIIGRLVRDPDSQQTPSGINYSRITIAVNRPFSKESKADFIPCIAWRNQASFITNYLKKGSLVSIEGRFSSSSYDNSDGKTIYVHEVTIENIQGLETLSSQNEREQSINEESSELKSDNKQKEENLNKEKENLETNETDETKIKNDVPWELDL